MTLSLFRILEANKGTIKVDSVDVSQVGLHDLRSRITIIPQEPVIFVGTIRENLDPLQKYSDQQLWDALELAHLKAFATELNEKLEFQLGEGGSNIRCETYHIIPRNYVSQTCVVLANVVLP